MTGEFVTLLGVPTVRYRNAAGDYGECLLERSSEDVLFAGMPVRDFRWYKGRRYYSG